MARTLGLSPCVLLQYLKVKGDELYLDYWAQKCRGCILGLVG
jgi:hypothetical protein